jgi:hypothetical protein
MAAVCGGGGVAAPVAATATLVLLMCIAAAPAAAQLITYGAREGVSTVPARALKKKSCEGACLVAARGGELAASLSHLDAAPLQPLRPGTDPPLDLRVRRPRLDG